MSEHTPGPWKVKNEYLYWAIRWNLGELASVPFGPSLINPRESEANAHLIAAAPEMLSAHQENARLLALVIHDLQGRIERGKLAALSQCLDRSRDAIALSSPLGASESDRG